VLDCEPVRLPVPAVVVPLILLLVIAFVPAVRNQPWTPLRIAGAAVTMTGCALLITARIQLGSSFSVRPQAKALVTRGLYSKIRHPMYVFLDIMLAGLILVSGVPWLLLFLAALAAVHILQARREDRVLREQFGQAYSDYRNRTWF
jgi:protein-S-isoprenylcysteine O-methyltransferase Ste14